MAAVGVFLWRLSRACPLNLLVESSVIKSPGLTALGARLDFHLGGDTRAKLSMGFFPICEHFHAVLIVSLAFTVVAMLLAMWKKTRPSVYCMFVSVLLQAVLASYPTCAYVVDLHGPSIGNNSTPRAAK